MVQGWPPMVGQFSMPIDISTQQIASPTGLIQALVAVAETKEWASMIAAVGRILLGVLVGAAVGFIVYEVRAATGGTCPITCNPYASVATGTVLGLLISLALAERQSN